MARDPYTPVAVIKAFMKIGLTLMPEEEIDNFPHAIDWVRSTDHRIPFAERCPFIRTFQPGPMPNDVLSACILRRLPHVKDVPYAFLVIGYGNETVQVMLPSQRHDMHLNAEPFSIEPYPSPGQLHFASYGPCQVSTPDMTGRDVVRGETVTIELGFAYSEHSDALE